MATETNGSSMVLSQMLAALEKEQAEAEDGIKCLAGHVEAIKVKRAEIDKLLAWKPGEPLPLSLPLMAAFAPPAPTTAKPEAPPAPATDQTKAQVEAMRAKHGPKWVRTEDLKKEFPDHNWAAITAAKLVDAKGHGRGRQYRVR